MNRVIASFTRSERNIIAFVLALVAVGYGILEYQERQKGITVFTAAPVSEASPVVLPSGLTAAGRININAADQAVLETLPGVGPSLAAAIIRHRTEHGPFHGLETLDAVPGVGPAMLTKMAPVVDFQTTATAAHLPGEPAPAVPAMALVPVQHVPVPPVGLAPGPDKATAAGAGGTVNINIASPEQLDSLDGVGPALAQRIIQDRARHGPFISDQSLLRVKGIGPAILRKNKGRITVQ